jgi:hypothetical protein
MFMFRLMLVLVLVLVGTPQMHVKLCPLDLEAFGARGVQVVSLHAQFGQLPLQVIQPQAKIEHGAEEHIAAQAAEDIQIKRFHFQRALIWLAA